MKYRPISLSYEILAVDFIFFILFLLTLIHCHLKTREEGWFLATLILINAFISEEASISFGIVCSISVTIRHHRSHYK
jgi:hypothetical protein